MPSRHNRKVVDYVDHQNRVIQRIAEQLRQLQSNRVMTIPVQDRTTDPHTADRLEGQVWLYEDGELHVHLSENHPNELHLIGATDEPAFANGWLNYAAGYEPAAFYKDLGGTVHLEGLIRTGTLGQAAFVLPAGYRPANIVHRAVVTAAGASHCEVHPNGNVIPAGGSNTWFSLGTVRFKVVL